MKRIDFALILLVLLSVLAAGAGCEKNANFYLHSGNAKYLAMKFKDALADYSQAIKLDSTLTEAYFERGRCYQQLKQYDMARRDFNTVIHQQPKSDMAKRATRILEEISDLKDVKNP